jgi:cobalt-zinc-cadmium efflux system outer membrane protein
MSDDAFSRRQLLALGGTMVGGAALLTGTRALAEPQHGEASGPHRSAGVIVPNGTKLPWRVVKGVKVFHLVAEEVDHAFAPGLKARCWGYNGQVHGPTIEAVEGDRVADQQLLEMWRSIVQAEQAAADLARKQLEAGNLQPFDLDQQLDQLGGAKLSLARAEVTASEDRERLVRLMGLWGKDVDFRVPSRLADPPHSDPNLDTAEAIAIRQRMDLAAVIAGRDALAYSLGLVKGTRYLPGVQLGVSTQRESPEGVRVTGPTLDLELPLFDQGQGRVGRLEAELRQAQDEVSALAVEIRSEVRATRTRFLAARATVDYLRREVLPLRERLVRTAQLQYNAMQIGLFRLLSVKQREIDGGREYVEALRDYWRSRASLERAVGGRLTADETQPPVRGERARPPAGGDRPHIQHER